MADVEAEIERRFQAFKQAQSPHTAKLAPSDRLPLQKYFDVARRLHKRASEYVTAANYTMAYVFLKRFAWMVVSTIPKHKDAGNSLHAREMHWCMEQQTRSVDTLEYVVQCLKAAFREDIENESNPDPGPDDDDGDYGTEGGEYDADGGMWVTPLPPGQEPLYNPPAQSSGTFDPPDQAQVPHRAQSDPLMDDFTARLAALGGKTAPSRQPSTSTGATRGVHGAFEPPETAGHTAGGFQPKPSSGSTPGVFEPPTAAGSTPGGFQPPTTAGVTPGGFQPPIPKPAGQSSQPPPAGGFVAPPTGAPPSIDTPGYTKQSLNDVFNSFGISKDAYAVTKGSSGYPTTTSRAPSSSSQSAYGIDIKPSTLPVYKPAATAVLPPTAQPEAPPTYGSLSPAKGSSAHAATGFVPPSGKPSFVPSSGKPSFVPPAGKPTSKFVPPAGKPTSQFVPPAGKPSNQFVPPSSKPTSQFVAPSGNPSTQFAPPAGKPTTQFVRPPGNPSNQFVRPPGKPSTQFVRPPGKPSNQFVRPSGKPSNQFVPPPGNTSTKPSSTNLGAPPTTLPPPVFGGEAPPSFASVTGGATAPGVNARGVSTRGVNAAATQWQRPALPNSMRVNPRGIPQPRSQARPPSYSPPSYSQISKPSAPPRPISKPKPKPKPKPNLRPVKRGYIPRGGRRFMHPQAIRARARDFCIQRRAQLQNVRAISRSFVHSCVQTRLTPVPIEDITCMQSVPQEAYLTNMRDGLRLAKNREKRKNCFFYANPPGLGGCYDARLVDDMLLIFKIKAIKREVMREKAFFGRISVNGVKTPAKQNPLSKGQIHKVCHWLHDFPVSMVLATIECPLTLHTKDNIEYNVEVGNYESLVDERYLDNFCVDFLLADLNRRYLMRGYLFFPTLFQMLAECGDFESTEKTIATALAALRRFQSGSLVLKGIFVPFLRGAHWSLGIVSFERRRLEYFDSLQYGPPAGLPNMLSAIAQSVGRKVRGLSPVSGSRVHNRSHEWNGGHKQGTSMRGHNMCSSGSCGSIMVRGAETIAQSNSLRWGYEEVQYWRIKQMTVMHQYPSKEVK